MDGDLFTLINFTDVTFSRLASRYRIAIPHLTVIITLREKLRVAKPLDYTSLSLARGMAPRPNVCPGAVIFHRFPLDHF